MITAEDIKYKKLSIIAVVIISFLCLVFGIVNLWYNYNNHYKNISYFNISMSILSFIWIIDDVKELSKMKRQKAVDDLLKNIPDEQD